MEKKYLCATCNKTKPGRFTRRKDHGIIALPRWYCWTCLPAGFGSDEEETMTSPKQKAMANVTASVAVVGREKVPTLSEGLALCKPLEPSVQTLTVSTADEYLAADELIGKIQKARKTWADRMEKIIRPIRSGLDEIYKLNREVDKPLAQLEERVKAKMILFRREEQRLLAEEQERQRIETARLDREREALERRSLLARTVPLKQKIAAQVEQLDRQQTLTEQMAPEPVRGMATSTRTQKKPVVTDWDKFCIGIGNGDIPNDVIALLSPRLNQYYKDTPDEVAKWPGVTIEDDIQIRGR